MYTFLSHILLFTVIRILTPLARKFGICFFSFLIFSYDQLSAPFTSTTTTFHFVVITSITTSFYHIQTIFHLPASF